MSSSPRDSFPDSFYCPLTHELMRDPVIDPEGNSYERVAIEAWLRRNATSPVTRTALSLDKLTPNRALKETIQKMANQAGVSLPEPEDLPLPQPSDNGVSLVCQVAGEMNEEMHLLASVVPPAQFQSGERTPCDVCCVIDVSGSMATEATFQNQSGDRESHGFSILDVVKHAVATIIHTLSENDRLAIVTYSNDAMLVFALQHMDASGRKDADSALELLEPTDSTNLWSGLQMGLDTLRESELPNRMRSVFLLTDGMPNITPPRGHMPMLKRYVDKHGLNASINTFGFGYCMDSPLMQDLAVAGDGIYAFIPDSGFVGTVFVNTLSNLLSVHSTRVTLSLEAGEGYELVPLNTSDSIIKTSWGLQVSLATLHVGQSRDFVCKVVPQDGTTKPTKSSEPLVTATVEYQLAQGEAKAPQRVEVEVARPAQREKVTVELERQRIRLSLVEVIQTHLCTAKDYDYNLAPHQRHISQWLAEHRLSPHAEDEQVKALLADASGQVSEAVSQPPYYAKWGKHYLPSLSRAHLLQQCHNFKDPGVQFYGGEPFNTIRDATDDIFLALPPPKPSRSMSDSYYGNSATSSSSGYSMPISMGSYYCAGNPCFTGDSLVAMADDSMKPCHALRQGDLVRTGRGGVTRVVCVVETFCENGETQLVTMPGGLQVTPYHPVRVDGAWRFPCDVAPSQYQACEKVFNFVLANDHSLMIQGVECVTLGHQFHGEVVQHSYFGSEQVVEDLTKCEGWLAGHVVFQSNCLRRCPSTHLVCGFDADRVIPHGTMGAHQFV